MSDTPGLMLENQPSGHPGRLGQWLADHDHPFEVHQTWRDPEAAFPDLDGYAWLAVLGSTHSAFDTDPTWIPRTREFMDTAIARDRPVLGICFGAQMLALALGGRVETMPRPEISWKQLEVSHPVMTEGPWLVWHKDAFEVPPGAEEVARSPLSSLAFIEGPHLGIQFHAEASPAMADRWLEEERDSLTPAGISHREVVEQGARLTESAAAAAELLFGAWWRLCIEGT